MAYPTYKISSQSAPPIKVAQRTGIQRFSRELLLLAALVLLVFWALSLYSYSPQDPAWSTSGSGSASVENWTGYAGALLADASYFVLGFSIWWSLLLLLKYVLFSMAHGLLRNEIPVQPRSVWQRLSFAIGVVLLLMSSTMLEWTHLYYLETYLPGYAGGVLGYLVGSWAQKSLGFVGSGVAGIAVLLLAISMVWHFSWLRLAERIGAIVTGTIHLFHARREKAKDVAVGKLAMREREVTVQQEMLDDPILGPHLHIESAQAAVPQSPRVAKEKQAALFEEIESNPLPQISLLDPPPKNQETIPVETLEMTSRLIERKLKDFGVQVTVVAAAPGPVVTRYEIEPATGVKGSQIVNLAKDLARSLSLISIRVIETIPGKNCMALELPNTRRQTIYLSEILGSRVYNEAKSLLSLGLGKDIIGNPVVADLAKMPHVLVAGTTGSGKSVGINGMILSLLYKAQPHEVRLIMIDPKMLEMSVYEGIAHLLAPVVTDMKQAANALNWCVGEMERRYKLMSKLGVRNLAGYNARIQEAKGRGEYIGNPFSLTPDAPEPLERLPHIVVVIDELADLMMVVGKKIEELIARLAQKARASGIHLILATQRPSVDVITGLIKANIPTRIAFQVSSKIDSRTILDQMGAETLLGLGDMLYMPSGTGFPTRVHGAFVSDNEVHRVVTELKKHGQANYVEGILEGGTSDDAGNGMGGEGGGSQDEKDPMYDQAVAVVLEQRKASISLVQRYLRIGYNRAARLVEDMERAGLVSPMGSNGQREILVPTRDE